MSDRPILMSAPMVRALLDGRKTQTRRLAWRVCKRCDGRGYHVSEWNQDCIPCPACEVEGQRSTIWQKVKPGDRLWVRECFSYDRLDVDHDHTMPPWFWVDGNPEHGDWTKPKPSIHMPRLYSRLTLIVTATKMERVQEIDDSDAMAEGIYLTHVQLAGGGGRVQETRMWTAGSGLESFTARSAFEDLWQSLHTKPGTRWEDNPELVALTFTVHQQNIDQMDRAA